MDTVDIAIVAAFVVAYSIISARLSTTVITGPMVFVLFGLIVGPDALNIVDLSLDNEVVRTLAELTLVLILYRGPSTRTTEATNSRNRRRREWRRG